MLRNASPDLTGPAVRRPRPRFVGVVAVLVAMVLAGGVAAAYQLEVRAGRPPSFAQGGEFLEALPAAGRDGRPYPYGDTSSSTTGAAPTTAAAPSTTPGSGGGPPGSTGRAIGPSSTEAPVPAESGPPASASPAMPRATAPVPATGVYTYAVAGHEAASGFGSRGFPASATVVVHGDPSIPTGSLVHDLHLSDQHEEREIVAYGADGAAFLYEAGSVTFGPGTQTSQGGYEPPMVQIPWPLADGASVSGTSAAKDGNGNVSRTEQWTTTVVGREVLDVLGAPHETWVVDSQRNTTGGGSETVDRHRRYWYDPQLGTWVQWTERFHGERAMFVTFTYDSEYTATLTAFTPG